MNKFEAYVESVLRQYDITVDGNRVTHLSADGPTRSVFLHCATDSYQFAREAISCADWDDDGSMDRDTAWYDMYDTQEVKRRLQFFRNDSLEAMRRLKHELYEWD